MHPLWELRKNRYLAQKRAARKEGAKRFLTFEEWIELWGEILDGPDSFKYQLRRFSAKQPYSKANCYVALRHSRNRSKPRKPKYVEVTEQLGMRTLSTNVPKDIWLKFQNVARVNKVTPAAYLRAVVVDVVAEECP